ncbi:DDE-type integrase/transposase/recombinase [Ktedonobacter robiniae]|uniref:DDE-type integrase/transposase/recombinase n=1 Tax=Ktedonobacter robiniae TaxID=2778365 RepID=UPI001914F221|nr:DDE-type integrase/transposase/recombinase [Ktedonobacter robiniae]
MYDRISALVGEGYQPRKRRWRYGERFGRACDERWPICGIPESLYSDHGSDFTSNHVQALAVDLKIELLYSQQGRPRGRGKIERFFRTVEQELLVDLPGYAREGWIGGCRRRVTGRANQGRV